MKNLTILIRYWFRRCQFFLIPSFFEALADEGGDAAMRTLREAAFEGGLDQEPSPRVQPYFSEGEWELSKTLVPLTLVEPDACFGVMSSLATPRGTPYTRFCGKPKDKCDVRSHQMSKLRPEKQIPGWYLGGGAAVRQGSILEIRFPLVEDGGPFSVKAGLQLLDPDRPFRMSFGQWLFLHSEWTSQRVESVPSDDASEFPLSLEVKTDLSDDRLSPASNVVGRVPPFSDEPPPTSRGEMSSQEDLDRQVRRLAILEATISSLRDELHSTRQEAARVVIAAYEGQEIVVGALRRRLDTAERVLKTTVDAQSGGTSSKSFVSSVEHALFNPQGELSAIKSQL